MCISQAVSVLLPKWFTLAVGVTWITFGPLAMYAHNFNAQRCRAIMSVHLTIFFVNKSYTVLVGFEPTCRLQIVARMYDVYNYYQLGDLNYLK